MSSDSLIHALAGAAGGMVAMTATYPLIVLSTRAAVDTSKDSKSTAQAIAETLKHEGFSGLYSGLGSSLLGIAAMNGVYYYFYERSRAILLKTRSGTKKALSTPESMLMGLIAGSASTTISNPIWVVQTSMSVREGKEVRRLSFAETVARILENGGFRAFFRGLGPALALVVNPILQYTVFEQLKILLTSRRVSRLKESGKTVTGSVLTDLDFFLLGAVSKLVATGITYPYIVIKSRMHAGSAAAANYKSALHGMLTVFREEGIGGLYKGIFSKIVQSVLTAAILFVSQRRIYELAKSSINNIQKAKAQVKR